jgi:hypothetical protein
MVAAEPWEYAFERQLEKRIEVLTAQVAEGGAKDYVDYVKLCGEIYGIQFSISTLKEVRKRLNADDDEDLRDDR